MNVTKRDGTKETLQIEKAHKVLEWATKGISGVSASDVAMKAQLKLYDGMPTTEIHKAFIDASEELILEDWHYAEVQSRLLLIDLLKRVYGDWDIIKPLSVVVRENSASGLYEPGLYEAFSEKEWAKFDTMIDHSRDYQLRGAGMKQFIDKYLVQDRSDGSLFETPQVAYALAAIAGLKNYKKGAPSERMAQIKETYEEFSKGKVNIPTPILAGVRQVTKQYASCVLIEVGDSLNSINTAAKIANIYASKRAGLGIGIGRIRPEGSRVGAGEIKHSGIIPFIRQLESAIKSCSQGGIRDASATVYFPIWHYEAPEILPLKSAKLPPDAAVRRLDYSAQWNLYLKRRATKGESITLFSPHEAKGLYDAFYDKDPQKFIDLYEKYEKDPTLKFKRVINGKELMTQFLTEGFETARIYDMNADLVNQHTPFLDPIRMSNLCVEICLPTEPVEEIHTVTNYETGEGTVQYKGLVELCVLSAVNAGDVDLDDPRDMKRRMSVLVTYLNELLDNQDYAFPQAQKAMMKFRPLGIGVVNYAYALARRGMNYDSQEALDFSHRFGEQMYYWALSASVDYAEYKGAKVPGWNRLIYSQGKTLLDTYCKNVDELTKQELTCDWDTLKARIMQYGVYNSTLIAYMPTESSSTVLNATSGFEPIRAIVTEKGNKKKILRQVAPEPVKLKNRYDYLWNMTPERFEGYIKVCAVLQKFCCQAMSVNFSYNPDHFPMRRVDTKSMVRHTSIAAKYGIKNRYYINTKGEAADAVDKITEEVQAKTGPELVMEKVMDKSPVTDVTEMVKAFRAMEVEVMNDGDGGGCGDACKI